MKELYTVTFAAKSYCGPRQTYNLDEALTKEELEYIAKKMKISVPLTPSWKRNVKQNP